MRRAIALPHHHSIRTGREPMHRLVAAYPTRLRGIAWNRNSSMTTRDLPPRGQEAIMHFPGGRIAQPG